MKYLNYLCSRYNWYWTFSHTCISWVFRTIIKGTAVIVDAGNGKVLYKQTPPSLLFGFGSDSGRHGMLGKGKIGTFFGGHDTPDGGRGFADHGGMMMGSRHMGPIGSSVPAR